MMRGAKPPDAPHTALVTNRTAKIVFGMFTEREAERRRNRTYRAGVDPSPLVLKTSRATRPRPLPA
jgi:hypothetical protein